MGDPHRKDRYGQLWPQHRIDAYLADLDKLRDLVIVSGGWAWHLMSPAGHAELRHAHDHKDLDLFVPPARVAELHALLGSMGYGRMRTQHDRKLTAYEFHRYERTAVTEPHPEFRITVDLFVGEPPSRDLPGGWRVVDPRHLIALYKTIHGSEACFAVRAAARLLGQGIDPVGRPELAQPPPEGRR